MANPTPGSSRLEHFYSYEPVKQAVVIIIIISRKSLLDMIPVSLAHSLRRQQMAEMSDRYLLLWFMDSNE